MTTTQAGVRPAGPLTYDQLHEKACVVCCATEALVPAGHRTVDGLVWPVAACPEHAEVAR